MEEREGIYIYIYTYICGGFLGLDLVNEEGHAVSEMSEISDE